MSYHPVHIHENRAFRKEFVLLLLIPALVFFLTLGLFSIFLSSNNEQITQTSSETAILGETNEKLDQVSD